jgi:AAA+ ATPase superfamily predicted ATPase
MKTIKFSFGRPVTPKHFYNRREEIDRILLRLLTIKDGVKNDLVLVGPRRVGKSSILTYLEWKLPQKNILPINIDCEGLDLVAFLKAYGNATMESEIRTLGLMRRFRDRMKRGFTEALSTMAEALGRLKTVEVSSSVKEFIRFRIEFDKTTHQRGITDDEIETLFERTIDLPNKLDRKCIVMFDEFQDTAMYSFSRGGFHANFRNMIKNQKNVAYLFTGSAIGMMDAIFGDPRNPLAGGAETIYIEPFNKDTSVSFLVTRFKEAGRKINDDVARYIYSEIGGFPLYLNWVGLRICDFVGENKTVTSNIAKRVCEEIHSLRSPIYQMLEKQLVKLGLKTRNIMYCLAVGYKSPPEIARESNVKNVYIYLERLQKYGLVSKYDGKYRLVDPNIREHLRRI